MQTILGAGGTTGIELAKQLPDYTKDIRLVSRNPQKINDTDQLMSADLSNPLKLDEAVKGSEVVYVCIAFDYKTAVWTESWPNFMKSLIASCSKHKAKIVFVDNMYMYDKNHLGHMTEETPINPSSNKGKVRAEIYLNANGRNTKRKRFGISGSLGRFLRAGGYSKCFNTKRILQFT